MPERGSAATLESVFFGCPENFNNEAAQAAFADRALLAEAAHASLDVQYYIWQRDAAGLILLDELRAAADAPTGTADPAPYDTR